MPNYQNILVTVDISIDYQPILEKAVAMQGDNAQLSVIHVVEPVHYPNNYAGSAIVDAQQKTIEYSQAELHQLGKRYGIVLEHQHVLVGQPGKVIHEFAEKNNIDLIVVGSHGKHGLQLLLGSTANAVLHGSKCDVLAVRVYD